MKAFNIIAIRGIQCLFASHQAMAMNGIEKESSQALSGDSDSDDEVIIMLTNNGNKKSSTSTSTTSPRDTDVSEARKRDATQVTSKTVQAAKRVRKSSDGPGAQVWYCHQGKTTSLMCGEPPFLTCADSKSLNMQIIKDTILPRQRC